MEKQKQSDLTLTISNFPKEECMMAHAKAYFNGLFALYQKHI